MFGSLVSKQTVETASLLENVKKTLPYLSTYLFGCIFDEQCQSMQSWAHTHNNLLPQDKSDYLDIRGNTD